MEFIRLTLSAEEYNIQNTFKPSFISSLYENPREGVWVKVAGHLGGRLKLEQAGRQVRVVCTANLEKDELERLVLGSWSRYMRRLMAHGAETGVNKNSFPEILLRFRRAAQP